MTHVTLTVMLTTRSAIWVRLVGSSVSLILITLPNCLLGMIHLIVSNEWQKWCSSLSNSSSPESRSSPPSDEYMFIASVKVVEFAEASSSWLIVMIESATVAISEFVLSPEGALPVAWIHWSRQSDSILNSQTTACQVSVIAGVLWRCDICIVKYTFGVVPGQELSSPCQVSLGLRPLLFGNLSGRKILFSSSHYFRNDFRLERNMCSDPEKLRRYYSSMRVSSMIQRRIPAAPHNNSFLPCFHCPLSTYPSYEPEEVATAACFSAKST